MKHLKIFYSKQNCSFLILFFFSSVDEMKERRERMSVTFLPLKFEETNKFTFSHVTLCSLYDGRLCHTLHKYVLVHHV